MSVKRYNTLSNNTISTSWGTNVSKIFRDVWGEREWRRQTNH